MRQQAVTPGAKPLPLPLRPAGRPVRAGLAAVVVATAGVIGGCASQAPAEKTITLYEHDTQQAANLDLGDPGAGPGDVFVFAGDVFDHQGGTRLGKARGNCTTVSGDATTPGDLHCALVFALDGGQVTADGLFDSTALFGGQTLPFTITGGTGSYRGARGEGTGQVPPDVPNQTDANFVLTLRPGA